MPAYHPSMRSWGMLAQACDQSQGLESRGRNILSSRSCLATQASSLLREHEKSRGDNESEEYSCSPRWRWTGRPHTVPQGAEGRAGLAQAHTAPSGGNTQVWCFLTVYILGYFYDILCDFRAHIILSYVVCIFQESSSQGISPSLKVTSFSVASAYLNRKTW